MSDIKPKQKTQASALEALKRTRRAQDLLVQGYTSRQTNLTLQKEYKISNRQANVYIQRAEQAFVEENPENRKLLKAKYSSMYLDLYRKAYAKDSLKLCREIIDSLAKISGLFESEIQSNSEIQINYKTDKN